jgi:Tfp pilus assembly protein PilV
MIRRVVSMKAFRRSGAARAATPARSHVVPRARCAASSSTSAPCANKYSAASVRSDADAPEVVSDEEDS